MNKVPMTKEGAEALKSELTRLKSEDRTRVITAIADARAHGDLKENAEYHAAKEQQGFIESRIAEVESKLSHAHVIDISKHNHDGRVIFGVTVTLENMSSGDEMVFKIVGDDESDAKSKKISVNSPMARAVIGKSEGDVFELSAPAGHIEYEVVKVDYI